MRRGQGVKYEEEARQKVALGGLAQLNLLLHPIIPAGGGRAGHNEHHRGADVDDNGDDEHARHGSGWS